MSNFMGAYPDVDKTLTQDGMAADAKAVGDALSKNVRVAKFQYNIQLADGVAGSFVWNYGTYLAKNDVDSLKANQVIGAIPVITEPCIGIDTPQSVMFRGSDDTYNIAAQCSRAGIVGVTLYVFYV